jgi:hypothetical protein
MPDVDGITRKMGRINVNNNRIKSLPNNCGEFVPCVKRCFLFFNINTNIFFPFVLLSAIILVDIDHPEQQDETIMVYKVAELVGIDKKNFYKGFSIHKKVDGRYIWDDPHKEHFTARIWTDDSILIGYPAGSYDHLKNPEAFVGELDKGVLVSMDEARNKFLEDPSRHIRYTLLQFPEPSDSEGGRSFGLSTKEIANLSEADETELELNYFPVVSEHKDVGKVENYMCVWNVVRLDIAPGKRGKPEEKPMSKAAQQHAARMLRKGQTKNSKRKVEEDDLDILMNETQR